MNNARSIVDRLLEDDPPVDQQPEQPAPAEDDGEDVRDMFLRLSTAPQPFHARGTAGSGLRRYQTMLDRLGNRPSRKISPNTYLIRGQNGAIRVRLHQTDIVAYTPDGTATFTTGGWPTKTTRDRMADWIPADWAIYTEPYKKHKEEAPDLWWDAGRRNIQGGLGKMFWYNRATNAGTWDSGWYIPFTDGDSIAPDGTLHHQAEPKRRGKKRASRGWP